MIMDSITDNTKIIIDLYQKSLNISTCVYDGDFRLIYNTSENEITETIFVRSGQKEILTNHHHEDQYPIILSAQLGSMWMVCFDRKEKTSYVLGPFLSSELSYSVTDEVLRGFDIPLRYKHHLIDYLRALPVVNYNSVFSYGIMLHYHLNNEKVEHKDIEIISSKYTTDSKTPVAKRDRLKTWKAEQMLMKTIEEGNINFRAALANAQKLSYGMRINTGDPLRQMKNSLLTFVTLSVRAGIRGGLTPEIAYSMGDMYSEKVEKANSMGDLSDIGQDMLTDFIRKVHAAKQNETYSIEIQTTIDYINIHIEEKLELSELASNIGYSQYYLSRKFKNETGVSINQYIREKKLALAKTLLKTSDLSVKEISEKLCYSSETYFSTLFSKTEGICPSEYRDKDIV